LIYIKNVRLNAKMDGSESIPKTPPAPKGGSITSFKGLKGRFE